ncbi:zinc-ribbon domain-containing protein [Candidatus Bathyarchaeota archaeon]|nr:zinc-ribbon domain-containing protein [Candidatus Bathyarchaeota archaeon]
MVYCSNCGKELNDDANFCTNCGTRTPKGIKEGVTIPWTETEIKQDLDKALKKASKAIDEGVKVARETLKEVASELDKEIKSVKEKRRPINCAVCGEENPRSAKYCTKCGNLL